MARLTPCMVLRPGVLVWVALLQLVGTPTAVAGNFPPVVEATAAPLEVLVGESVQFSSAETFDPDDGPQPLSLAWDFGDGTMDAGPSPVHAYDALGLYTATLSASDGLSTTLGFVEIVVVAPPTASPPRHSSSIALSPDEAAVGVANPDSGTVSIVTLESGEVTEIEVGGRPLTVAWSDDGQTLWSACADDRSLWAIDTATGQASATALGVAPWGVVPLVDGRLLVSAPAAGSVLVIDGEDVALVETAPEPHALAVDSAGALAWVTHFRTTDRELGRVSVIDLETLDVVAEVPLGEDPGPDTASSGRGFPNLLGSAVMTPAGDRVWVGGLKSNTSRGEWLDGNPLTPRNRVRGAMFPLDPLRHTEVMARRLDTNDADSVAAIAFSPLGRFAYLVHQGAGTLSVYDLPKAALVEPGAGDTATFETRIELGHAPNGIAITADGTRAYVRNELSRDVMVIDLSLPSAAAVIETIIVTQEPLPAELLLGKQLFHRSRAPEHADQNYIACASCHPDGGNDGRTWDFTQAGEGLRNTTDLRGHAGTGDGPVHWSANFDEIQDFENDIVNGFGGTGLAHDGMPPFPPLDAQGNAGRSVELDALAAYVTSLATPPRSPWREPDGSLGEAALRGKALFFSAATGCATCHAPPRLTDSTLAADPFVLHDVGTLLPSSGGRLGGELLGIDTPSVIGVWASAPYLHDGRAATLHEVLTTWNPNDAHGATSMLGETDLDDLVAFMLALQGDADELPEPDAPDDTSGTGSSSADDGLDGSTSGTLGDATAESSGTGTSAATGEGDGCVCRTREPPSGRGRAPALLSLALIAAAGRRRRKNLP
jgi:MYXO-CTERM domain-containing protein